MNTCVKDQCCKVAKLVMLQCCQVALSPSCQVAMLQRGKVATWLQTDIRTDGCTYGRTDIHTDKLASWATVAAKKGYDKLRTYNNIENATENKNIEIIH